MNKAHIASLAVLLAATSACSDNNGSGPPANTMAGTWVATKLEFVEAVNPSNKIEVVALGGALTFTITEAGAFTIVSTMPGEAPLTNTGTWSMSADVMTLHFLTGMSGTWQFDYSLNGSTLSLSGAHTEFDVDDDGVDEDARINLVVVKS